MKYDYDDVIRSLELLRTQVMLDIEGGRKQDFYTLKIHDGKYKLHVDRLTNECLDKSGSVVIKDGKPYMRYQEFAKQLSSTMRDSKPPTARSTNPPIYINLKVWLDNNRLVDSGLQSALEHHCNFLHDYGDNVSELKIEIDAAKHRKINAEYRKKSVVKDMEKIATQIKKQFNSVKLTRRELNTGAVFKSINR